MRQLDLEGRIRNYISKLPTNDQSEPVDNEAILKAIESQHGLLVERAQAIYSFSHLTFHEYFTARYIIEHPSDRLFREYTAHATDSRWREVLLLTASMLDVDNAKLFFDCFIQTLDETIVSSQMIGALFVWAMQTAAASGTADFTTRLYYLRTVFTAKLIPEIAGTRTLAAVLAGALTRASDLAGSLANILAHDRTSTRSLANDLANELGRASNRASTIANELASASNHATISGLALVHARVSTSANTLAIDLANISILAKDLASENIRVGTSDRADELARDLTSASEGSYDLARRSAHASILARVRDQANASMTKHHSKISLLTQFNNDLRILAALTQAQMAVTAGQEKVFTKEIQGIWQQVMNNKVLAQPGQKQLYAELQTLTLPATNASKNTWRQFSGQLQKILIHRGYGVFSEQLNESQYLQLNEYFQALSLLLECLDLATVGERAGIRNRLMLPPKTTITT